MMERTFSEFVKDGNAKNEFFSLSSKGHEIFVCREDGVLQSDALK